MGSQRRGFPPSAQRPLVLLRRNRLFALMARALVSSQSVPSPCHQNLCPGSVQGSAPGPDSFLLGRWQWLMLFPLVVLVNFLLGQRTYCMHSRTLVTLQLLGIERGSGKTPEGSWLRSVGSEHWPQMSLELSNFCLGWSLANSRAGMT